MSSHFNYQNLVREIRAVLPKKYWGTVIEDALRSLGTSLRSSKPETRKKASDKYVNTLDTMCVSAQTVLFGVCDRLGFTRELLQRRGLGSENGGSPHD